MLKYDGYAELVLTLTGSERAYPALALIGELVPCTWNSWLHPSPEGGGPSSLIWPTQLTPRHTSRVFLSWKLSTSIPSMTGWSTWRDWPCGTIGAGAPRFEAIVWYLRGDLVRVQHWRYTRSQRPWTWLTILDAVNVGKWSRLDKSLLHDTKQLPVPLKQMKKSWRGGKDKGAKCFFLFFVCCCGLLFCFLIIFLFIFFYFYYIFIISFKIFLVRRPLQGWMMDTEELGKGSIKIMFKT